MISSSHTRWCMISYFTFSWSLSSLLLWPLHSLGWSPATLKEITNLGLNLVFVAHQRCAVTAAAQPWAVSSHTWVNHKPVPSLFEGTAEKMEQIMITVYYLGTTSTYPNLNLGFVAHQRCAVNTWLNVIVALWQPRMFHDQRLEHKLYHMHMWIEATLKNIALMFVQACTCL